MNFLTKLMKNGQNATFWEISGQERFKIFASEYIKDSMVILIIYSSNKKESFNNVSKWFEFVKSASTTENKYIYLVCNQEDSINSMNISKEEGMAFAEKLNINFCQLSIKENIGVKELWEKLQIIGSAHQQNIDAEAEKLNK